MLGKIYTLPIMLTPIQCIGASIHELFAFGITSISGRVCFKRVKQLIYSAFSTK